MAYTYSYVAPVARVRAGVAHAAPNDSRRGELAHMWQPLREHQRGVGEQFDVGRIRWQNSS